MTISNFGSKISLFAHSSALVNSNFLQHASFGLYLHVTQSQTYAYMARLDTYSNEHTSLFGRCKQFLEAKY